MNLSRDIERHLEILLVDVLVSDGAAQHRRDLEIVTLSGCQRATFLRCTIDEARQQKALSSFLRRHERIQLRLGGRHALELPFNRVEEPNPIRTLKEDITKRRH